MLCAQRRYPGTAERRRRGTGKSSITTGLLQSQPSATAKVIADGNAAAADSIVAMTKQDAGIAWPKNLAGQKVAIQQARSVAELLRARSRRTTMPRRRDEVSASQLPGRGSRAPAAK